jgi:15-cis-phytoene synthase
MTALRPALEEAARALGEEFGIRPPRIEGKLLRPRVALAMARNGGGAGSAAAEPDPAADPAFVQGVLAIQMVHEASLLHDDILDGCSERRGQPSLMAEAGVAVALVEGDHLLTAAYRAACATGSLDFVQRFSRAVERTVAGEKAQARARGRVLGEAEYREIVSHKSGELFGCAASLAASLRGDVGTADAHHALGVRLGCLYQMIDDLLDLCPGAELGKPPLLDYGQRKWSWVLAEAGIEGFDLERDELLAQLFESSGTGSISPARHAVRRLELEADRLAAECPGDLSDIVAGWLSTVHSTIAREERVKPGASSTSEAEADIRALTAPLGGPDEWMPYFAHHSRSFRFSSRFFPKAEGRLVAGVYAFCRFTDDLVDEAGDLDPAALEERLATWDDLVVQAHEAVRGASPHDTPPARSHAPGPGATGISLLDEVLGETARRGVPALYARELIRGVAMDLHPGEYPDLEALRRYSYRVASVVGLWLTELFGTHEPGVLRRAEAMGHAMQLTNILRDVGEDLRRGRLYLPLDRMQAHGITRDELERVALAGGGCGAGRRSPDGRGAERGGERGAGRGRATLPPGYRGLMDELIAQANADYECAMEGVPALPPFFQRPVAVAGRVYRGIHREIRRNGYDNLTLRAHTSFSRKLLLGSRGLWEMREARKVV